MTEPHFDPFAGGEIVRICPTTASQQEIITSSKMSDEANTAFNEAVSLSVDGDLDVPLLERCLNAIVNRHDAFQATFSPAGNEIYLQSPRPLTVVFEDLRKLSPDLQQRALSDLYKNIAISPMNLEEGPLVFAWVKQLGDRRFEIVLAMHHVVADGWSIGLILKELAELYRNDGTEPAAMGDTVSFFDFAERQAASQIANSDIDYWNAKFSELPLALDLPLDKPRPSSRSFRAARHDYLLGRPLVASLPKAASTLKSSLVNYVLAGYFALLHRLTGNEDIVVGLPLAGQAAMGQPNLVGHLVHLLPIRVRMGPEATFSQLVKAVKTEVLNASEHPNFTFGTLLENRIIDRSRVPLVSTIFNIDQAMPPLDFSGASVRVRSVPRAAENFEMFVNVVPSSEDFLIEVTYSTALFSEATVVAWMQALEAILSQAVNNPDMTIAAQKLTFEVPEALRQSNQTQQNLRFADVVSAFAAQVKQTPNATAAISGDRRLSYAELQTQVTTLAAALSSRGIQPHDVVGICCDRNASLLVATLAVMSLGAAYLPLDPDFPPERLNYMIEDSGAVAVLEDACTPDPVRAAAAKHFPIAELLSEQSAGGDLSGVVCSADQVAYLIYTSGSTGKPKGVCVPHGAMINFLESMVQQPGCTEGDVLLAVTTLSFDISVLELFLPLLVGATVVIAGRDDVKDGERLAGLLAQHRVTAMQATPSSWRMLLASDWGAAGYRPIKLKALCGGESLPATLVADLAPRVGELWNMYGPTETTVWSACKRIHRNDAAITVGKPIANTQLYVLDASLNPLPISAPGELFIGGAGVTLGYHNRPELTAERFIDHPDFGRIYRTGDLAKVMPDGEIQHLGRLDDQVKLRGYRIELGEIETALNDCGEIDRAVVYLWELDEQDVRIVACCVPTANKPLDTISIRKRLRERLPMYMIPQYYLALGDIPLTPNGKIDRRSLPRPELSESAILAQKSLKTASEKLIAGIWADLLKCDEAIGGNDNFFELGGHSLLALEAIRRMENAANVRLKLADIVVNSLSALAQKLSAGETEQQSPVSRPEAVSSTLPRQLSPEQSRLLNRQLNAPRSTCNNLPAAWVIDGPLDVDKFRHSVERLVERQTALRTVIVMGDEGPRQKLLHSTDMDIPEIRDYSDAGDALSSAITDFMDYVTRPFAATGQPLCRFLLYKLAEEKYLFAINCHQLIFDGWSFDIFLAELKAYYLGFLENRAVTLDPLPFQFRDYAEWASRRIVDQATLEYHRRSLDSDNRMAGLVDIFAEKAQCRREENVFDKNILEHIEKFCERFHCRLHEAFFACFVLACAEAEKSNDLVVGLPVTGRHMPDVIGLVGGFVSILPFEIRIRSGHFVETVRDIAQQVSVFYEHQDITFSELVADTPYEKQLFPECLPLLFAFQDIRNRPREFAGLKLSQIDIDRDQTELPIEFWVRVESDRILTVFDFDSNQVSDEAVALLKNKLAELLSTIDRCEDTGLVSSPESGVSGPDEKKPFWRRLFQ